MNGYIYCYLRASTKDQDANRAREAMQSFLDSHGVRAAGWYVENESGAKLERPELMSLIDDAQPGDFLLVEQVDRLSRLNADDWQKLRGTIDKKGLKVVALDLPTSHMFLTTAGDEFTARIMQSINAMMLDMLAAIARKDYLDRRRRQAEGVKRAKAEGRYKGKRPNYEKHEEVIKYRKAGYKIDDIVKLAGVSRATVFNIIKRHKENTQ